MFKKTIIVAAIISGIGLSPLGQSVQADQISSQPIDLSSLTELNNASKSLNLLRHTMNNTVLSVSQEKEKQDAEKAAQSAKTIQGDEKTSADKLIELAKKYIGVPYVWGGSSPSGFDCSGFTSYVYREALGKEIGRTSYNQIGNGKKVTFADAKVGDVLVFFGGSHVGIYLGNGEFIHAPKPGDQVKISSISGMTPDYALEY
ncbi:C40 family peptidase [Lactococcus fujiensis]|uniref:Gamma-D-glutamyl-meso-diaminopimelate peptidase I, NlpC/P60 family n=1 Tax=Lactococcus fujiensis JCM 16395 TaxID=1291764 RepID=A0A2A5RNG4_9LACT|nr:C40 family peptidase [Lactococcus fujiensis]PCS00906.1 Gamma-D-glutamyl-meso-diaminopimelate peptidase I, NlpC/P60 family [Lactococcus fujiensis JCM 16395]